MQALKVRVKLTGLLAVALAATVALTMGGCDSSGPAINGPLSGGAFGEGRGAGTCAPARLGKIVTFGDEVFTNHGHTTLTLDRVTLLRPRNERLIGSYAVPGIRAVGLPGGSWPPRNSHMPYTWKDRQPVHGFRLAAGKSFNMVLGITATAVTSARSPGMMISYHDSSGSYVTDNYFTMVIAVNKRSCARTAI